MIKVTKTTGAYAALVSVVSGTIVWYVAFRVWWGGCQLPSKNGHRGRWPFLCGTWLENAAYYVGVYILCWTGSTSDRWGYFSSPDWWCFGVGSTPISAFRWPRWWRTSCVTWATGRSRWGTTSLACSVRSYRASWLCWPSSATWFPERTSSSRCWCCPSWFPPSMTSKSLPIVAKVSTHLHLALIKTVCAAAAAAAAVVRFSCSRDRHAAFGLTSISISLPWGLHAYNLPTDLLPLTTGRFA